MVIRPHSTPSDRHADLPDGSVRTAVDVQPRGRYATGDTAQPAPRVSGTRMVNRVPWPAWVSTEMLPLLDRKSVV